MSETGPARSKERMNSVPGKSLLILGGARSGKSRYAQQLAERSGACPVLIATAQAHDEEMAARIASHAARRGSEWSLVEEPLDLAGALDRAARAGSIIVVDCLTLWLSNLMLADADFIEATARLTQRVARLAAPAIFVSNEVGLAIVPDNPLGRTFRDAQGSLNQALAEACEAVVFMAAGLPLQLKPAEPPVFKFLA